MTDSMCYRCTRVKCRQVCIIHCLKKLGSLRELNKASRTKITNERCEFVNCVVLIVGVGPVLLRHNIVPGRCSNRVID